MTPIGYVISIGRSFLQRTLGDKPSWGALENAKRFGDRATASGVAEQYGGEVYALSEGVGDMLIATRAG